MTHLLKTFLLTVRYGPEPHDLPPLYNYGRASQLGLSLLIACCDIPTY